MSPQVFQGVWLIAQGAPLVLLRGPFYDAVGVEEVTYVAWQGRNFRANLERLQANGTLRRLLSPRLFKRPCKSLQLLLDLNVIARHHSHHDAPPGTVRSSGCVPSLLLLELSLLLLFQDSPPPPLELSEYITEDEHRVQETDEAAVDQVGVQAPVPEGFHLVSKFKQFVHFEERKG